MQICMPCGFSWSDTGAIELEFDQVAPPQLLQGLNSCGHIHLAHSPQTTRVTAANSFQGLLSLLLK